MIEGDMTHLGKQIRRWGPHEVEHGWRRLRMKMAEPPRPTRGRWRIALGSLGVVAATMLALLLANQRVSTPSVAQSVPPRSGTTLRFNDGSLVEFDAGSEVIVAEQTPGRVRIEVRVGSARFRVVHDRGRIFRVDAGPIEICDLGTEFMVRRVGPRTLVAVSEGSVSIAFDNGAVRALRTLIAGQSGLYPLSDPPLSASAFVDGSGSGADKRRGGKHHQSVSAAPTSTSTWRALARSYDYHRAYRALSRTGAEDVHDDTADLLLAADVARLSGHPAEALAPLRGVVERHDRDARAPAAAFMLGWVLTNDLHRSAEAAQAFAKAVSLAPNGNLAEDAAARAAEAWQRAGKPAMAVAEVRRYIERYPHGRYRATLEQLIGGH